MKMYLKSLRNNGYLVLNNAIPYNAQMIATVDKLISKTEDEMFNDWPERASTEVFYGGNDYHLDIRKHQEYIYSSFGYSSCDLVNAFGF